MSTEISRRERKKEETRTRIFKAATRLFRDRGFEATTVDDITEKADVAKGTFFNYFPKKEAVLAYLSEQRLEEAEANAASILSCDCPTREKVLQVYGYAASAYAEDRELSRYVIIELMKRAFEPGQAASERWRNLLVRIIRQGQESGELRLDVDPVRAESLLGSLYIATVYMWVCCIEGQFDLQEELTARLTLALDGIAAPGAPR